MIKDVSDYFVDKNKSTQYDYKILLYGNYTYRKNLEADSLVEVLRHTIPFISKRWKVHFTLLIPEFVQSLDFPIELLHLHINQSYFYRRNILRTYPLFVYLNICTCIF